MSQPDDPEAAPAGAAPAGPPVEPTEAAPSPAGAVADESPPAGSAPDEPPPAGSPPEQSAPEEPGSGDSPPAGSAPPGPGRRRVIAWLVGGLLAGAVLVAAAGLAAVNLFREDQPQVGDCLTDAATAEEMDVVDCGGERAYWSVVGGDGTWTYGDFEAAQPGEVCAGHPRTQQALWFSGADDVAADTEGEVVCLAPVQSAPEPEPSGPAG